MLIKFIRGMSALFILAPLVAGVAGVALGAGGGNRFEVTVTNLTRGQIISPAVVASHSDDLSSIFTVGTPASSELAAVAEDAVIDPMITLLSADPEVMDVATILGAAGPIMPGESASVVVNARGRFRNFTVVGMLVSTNDAFFALNGRRGPNRGSESHYSPAYDAGSEANNEDCAFIPGPPCGNEGVRDPAGAEGYVHIHAGIHGIGSLAPADLDWRNPVAK
ncbi:MAG: spondin domain-containing protein, partial [Deltaproteobacteria bacterium]|nr:spondin domain-containing protein [Deltaproteobacteria bacterium]